MTGNDRLETRVPWARINQRTLRGTDAKRPSVRTLVAGLCALCLCLFLASCSVTPQPTDSAAQTNGIPSRAFAIDHATIDAATYLDYQAGIDAGVYRWVPYEDGDIYVLAAVDADGEPITVHQPDFEAGLSLEEQNSPEGVDLYQGVYMNANITNLANQTMLIYVPAAYLQRDESGVVTGIDHTATVGDYTADTAPIVYANQCSSGRSSSPHACERACLERGMIYVSAGARGRDALDEHGAPTGKYPIPIADLKAGIIALRANDAALPGDAERIVSTGRSGGGEMGSVLGASGDMEEYLPYLYDVGALGVQRASDGTYTSLYSDAIYGTQCYCPIADLENADLAFAWWWVDLVDEGGVLDGGISPFKRRLQELEAEAFVDYLNGLGLTDDQGRPLTLKGLRSGSYYDLILANLSEALNASVRAGATDPATAYPDAQDWLERAADGTWHVTDLKGFMLGTGLVHQRGKDIPGFDTLDKTAYNSGFGTSKAPTAHFSRRIAQILEDHYDELSKLEGFDAEQVDSFIEEALTGSDADHIANQTRLMNATTILLGREGLEPVHVAPHWRIRSGTLDEHTSYSIGYNIAHAARTRGADVDYSLVWDMIHSNDEGTTTGTYVDWVCSICPGPTS